MVKMQIEAYKRNVTCNSWSCYLKHTATEVQSKQMEQTKKIENVTIIKSNSDGGDFKDCITKSVMAN